MGTPFDYIKCIEKVKQRDESAGEELYRFTYPIVQKQVLLFIHQKQDQEDLLQNIYIKIFEQLETLKEPEKYPGWAKTIARNTCMLHIRQLKTEQNHIVWKTVISSEDEEGMDQIALPVDSREYNPEAHIDAQTTKELIDQIMDGLSDKQRMVILLWMKQYKLTEISEELDMPLETVRTNCRRGKAFIEKKVLDLEKKGTKLYSMSPIVFFMWLLEQYDTSYIPSFTDISWKPLCQKLKEEMLLIDKEKTMASAIAKKSIWSQISRSTITKAIAGIAIISIAGGSIVYSQMKPEKKEEPVKIESEKKTGKKVKKEETAKPEENKVEEQKKEETAKPEEAKETSDDGQKKEEKKEEQVSEPKQETSTTQNTPSSQSSVPAQVHNHKWVTKAATGHYVTQTVTAAYDEPIYETLCVFPDGHTCKTADEAGDYSVDTGLGYSVKSVQTGTKHHDAVTKQVWVQDTAAYRYCTECGATEPIN